MKQLLLLFVAMLHLTAASAYDLTDDKGLYYNKKSDGTLEVVGLKTSATKADILSSVTISGQKYRITSIGERAFEGRSDLTYLSIPYSVKSIGKYAFMNCGKKISVNIADPESWCQMELGNEHSSPLSSAGKLLIHDIETNQVDIPKSVTSINAFTFYQCSCIKTLNTPVSVESISSSAFEDCDNLTSLNLSEGLESIGGSAFEGCTNLKTLSIPSTVTRIKINAFKNCTSITDVFCLATKVPTTDEKAFDGTPTKQATLHVPSSSMEAYENTWPWSNFQKVYPVSTNSDIVISVLNGVTYQGTKSSKTVVVKSVDKSLASLEIPASVSYDGTTYQVSGIADGTFDGSNMGALIWNVEAALPNSVFSNASIGSNFLLYVKSASYAPSSIKNVIVNGTASSVVLSDDGGQFYCPQVFTARSISYSHHYSMETGGDGKGWETIVLPFDVQRIVHSNRGEIVPFASYSSGSSSKPFWLATMSSSGFKRASSILAYEPYIIAMPNNSKYKSDYNLAGEVTFSADNVQVAKTPTFSGLFLPAFATVSKASNVYALNVNNRYVTYSGNYDAGSHFISYLRDVRPFEAYMTGSSSSRGVIEINFDESTTDIDTFLLSTDDDREVTIHTLSGQKVACTIQRDFDAVWQQLHEGVFIVNGKKMIK